MSYPSTLDRSTEIVIRKLRCCKSRRLDARLRPRYGVVDLTSKMTRARRENHLEQFRRRGPLQIRSRDSLARVVELAGGLAPALSVTASLASRLRERRSHDVQRRDSAELVTVSVDAARARSLRVGCYSLAAAHVQVIDDDRPRPETQWRQPPPGGLLGSLR